MQTQPCSRRGQPPGASEKGKAWICGGWESGGCANGINSTDGDNYVLSWWGVGDRRDVTCGLLFIRSLQVPKSNLF